MENNPLKKWVETLHRDFITKDIQMANQHMKRCLISLAIRKVQTKTTMRYNYTLVRMAKVFKMPTPNAGEDLEKLVSPTWLVGK